MVTLSLSRPPTPKAGALVPTIQVAGFFVPQLALWHELADRWNLAHIRWGALHVQISIGIRITSPANVEFTADWTSNQSGWMRLHASLANILQISGWTLITTAEELSTPPEDVLRQQIRTLKWTIQYNSPGYGTQDELSMAIRAQGCRIRMAVVESILETEAWVVSRTQH